MLAEGALPDHGSSAVKHDGDEPPASVRGVAGAKHRQCQSRWYGLTRHEKFVKSSTFAPSSSISVDFKLVAAGMDRTDSPIGNSQRR